MSVRAAVLYEAGKPLEVQDIDLAPTGPGQVRVRIAASGVCHSDLSLATGVLPHPTPVVLGHEGAGVVTEVGAGVEHVRPGDHVVLSWMPACRSCPHCAAGEPYLCERAVTATLTMTYASLGDQQLYSGLGTATFATETLTLADAVVPIDPSIPLDIAALVGCAVTTGVGAVLHTAKVPAGSTVAVVGCGGVGLSAVMGAHHAGAARVIAVDLFPERLEVARSVGATDAVVGGPNAVAEVRALTGGHGVDYAFEVVGKPATIRLAFDVTRRGGSTVVVGAGSPADAVEFNAFELFFMARHLIGCVYGSADPPRDFPALLALYGEGRLPIDRLVTNRISLDEVNDALAAMVAGEGARSLIVN